MPKRPALDQIDQEVLDFVRRGAVFPKLKAIAQEFKWKSTRAAAYRLEKLVQMTYLEKPEDGRYVVPADLVMPPSPKGRRVVGAKGATVPDRGKVSCGAGVENDEEFPNPPLDVSSLLVRDGVAVFEAVGTSMIDAHIKSGDLLFVRENPDPPTGATVIVMLDRSMLCKKLAVRNEQRVVLKPANGELSEFDFNPQRRYFRILGVLTNVLRKV